MIADLNKTITITRDMLPQDVRDELNATIGMNRLSAEVIEKLDQNGSLMEAGIVAGSLISGALWISLLLRDIRFISGGTEGIGLGGESSCECGEIVLMMEWKVLDGKIYFVGGSMEAKRILLKDMILNNTWQTIASSCLCKRRGVASAVLKWKTVCNWRNTIYI